MTEEDIAVLARDAGLTCYGGSKQSNGLHSWHAYTHHLTNFARLIQQKQREIDAALCEAETPWGNDADAWAAKCLRKAAAAIRGQT